MKKIKIITILTIVLFCSSTLMQSYANSLGYGNALYTNTAYSYASEVNMPTSVFNDTQIRINKALYAQANIICSEDHYNACFGNIDSVAFTSFRKYFNALCPLAFSIAEWGGSSDLRYSFTPAIATKRLANVGIDMNTLDPLQVNTEYYTGFGITSFGEKSYWGPLQINKAYLTPDSNYKCGYVPLDYYCWADACQWTFHHSCDLIKSTWNKNYEFKNQYSVIAHMSIAHNSGGNHLVSSSMTIDKNWYPWANAQAVYNYVDFITSEQSLSLILNDADKYADELLQKYKDGTASGALYKSIDSCRQLTASLNINWSNYVKSKWLGNMATSKALEGDALRNWEKVMYPVQSIWNYRVLERLYGLV